MIDQELLERVRSCDAEAGETLYNELRSSPAVKRWKGELGDEWEDAVVDLWYKVRTAAKNGQFHGRSLAEFWGFVSTVINNISISILRCRRREPTLTEVQEPDAAPLDTASPERLETDVVTRVSVVQGLALPLMRLLAGIQTDLVENRGLGNKQRTILEEDLRSYLLTGERSRGESAEAAGQKASSADKNRHDGVQRLRGAFRCGKQNEDQEVCRLINEIWEPKPQRGRRTKKEPDGPARSLNGEIADG